jgi:hypothetical protein
MGWARGVGCISRFCFDEPHCCVLRAVPRLARWRSFPRSACLVGQGGAGPVPQCPTASFPTRIAGLAVALCPRLHSPAAGVPGPARRCGSGTLASRKGGPLEQHRTHHPTYLVRWFLVSEQYGLTMAGKTTHHHSIYLHQGPFLRRSARVDLLACWRLGTRQLDSGTVDLALLMTPPPFCLA